MAYACALARGKPSECHASRTSHTGQSATGAWRMVASPNGTTSNSPLAARRRMISATGLDAAFLSMAHTPRRTTGGVAAGEAPSLGS